MPQPDEQHAGLPNVPDLARLSAVMIGAVLLTVLLVYGAMFRAPVGTVLAACGLLAVGTSIFTFLIAATIYSKDLHDDIDMEGELSKEPDPREFPVQKEDFVREQKVLAEGKGAPVVRRHSA